ncbi:MAG: FtsX-like permease family protein [Candidatus Thiodiazotropha sp. (ex Monitilora ramsayi)]|nr:FtsX-like permease family protein [Candidatus Thiodiazotropha sp. (ex Monitilora ramsayi)]
MNTLSLALKLLRRDWRAGELRLLVTALVIAVASVASVGFFTDRIERAMQRQAAEVLAADLRLDSGQPFDASLLQTAKSLQLEMAQTVGFPSVLLHDGKTQLVQVKAVSPTYPLRGKLLTRASATADDTITDEIPAQGEIWLEDRLLPLLGLAVGDNLKLGQRQFRIGRIITYEPDRAANLFQLAPRAMISLQDLAATALLGPGSRVRHRLLLAGEENALLNYRSWLEQQALGSIQIEDIRGARPELRLALDRGGRFLRLTAATAILLCVVAVALSSRRFVERQADTSALLRCLGASRRQVARIFFLRLMTLGLIASLAGTLIGLAVQAILINLVGHWFTQQIPPPGLWPVFSGLGTGILVLTGFSLPSVLRLSRVPPLRVFRRHLGAPSLGYQLSIGAAIASLAILLIWQIGDDQLATRLIGGLLGGLALLLLISRLLVTLLRPLRSRAAGSWRYGLASLSRNPATTSVQLTGFGLGITVLLILTLVRVDLLDNWRNALPADSPNQFLINIQPQEVDGVKQMLDAGGLDSDGPYPMIRGRLIRINDQAITPDIYESPRAQRLANRDFNLSLATEMQSDNKIVAGRWWNGEEWDKPWFSVEEGIARDLGIPMDAILVFEVAGQEIEGRVTSLRTVQWDSFNVNFFVVGTPGLMAEQPASYITSFHLPKEQRPLLHRLIQQYPSITALDVSALIQQVRAIMDRGVMAVESVFLFTLIAGIIVLYAGIQASRELRIQEAAILRTLGLSRRRLLTSVALEFTLLGGLAGIISAALASVISYTLATAVFELTWQPNAWLWVVAIAGGALGVGLSGVIASWTLLNRPPLVVLRQD